MVQSLFSTHQDRLYVSALSQAVTLLTVCFLKTRTSSLIRAQLGTKDYSRTRVLSMSKASTHYKHFVFKRYFCTIEESRSKMTAR